MSRITVKKQIYAPLDLVFRTVADIRNFSEVITDITNIHFLTNKKYGLGTRFRETRNMNGRMAETELEVTELKDNEMIRLISDAGGTRWDSVFKVKEANGSTQLILEMKAEPYKFLSKLTLPLMKGVIKKALESDMSAVKRYCESQ